MSFFFATTEDLNPFISDGFGRLRVSNPETIFELSHLYDKQPLLTNELTATGASSTYLPNESTVRMDVTSATGSRIVRQTRNYFNYQPGKSLQVLLTGVMSTVSGGEFRVVKRSYISGSQVDTKVVINTGTFDLTKAQIFTIDSVEWLGVGTVVMALIIDGKKVKLHQFDHANLIDSVYNTRMTLPIRYELEKTSTGVICRIGYFDNHADKTVDVGGNGFFFEYEATTASADSMKMICATVISEGGFNPKGKEFTVDNGNSSISVTAERPVLSLRLKNAYNRAKLVPLNISIITGSASNIIYRIYYGGTLTGASFNTVNANSATEFDVSATAITGGLKIDSGYLSTQFRQLSNEFDGILFLGTTIEGVQDIVTITAQNLSGGAASVYSSLSFQEIL
jgi:hypothetical protein